MNYVPVSKILYNPPDPNPAVTYAAFQHQGRLFWITCNRPKLLRKAGRLQLIQNSTPSVALMRQCCIRIEKFKFVGLVWIYLATRKANPAQIYSIMAKFAALIK